MVAENGGGGGACRLVIFYLSIRSQPVDSFGEEDLVFIFTKCDAAYIVRESASPVFKPCKKCIFLF